MSFLDNVFGRKKKQKKWMSPSYAERHPVPAQPPRDPWKEELGPMGARIRQDLVEMGIPKGELVKDGYFVRPWIPEICTYSEEKGWLLGENANEAYYQGMDAEEGRWELLWYAARAYSAAYCSLLTAGGWENQIKMLSKVYPVEEERMQKLIARVIEILTEDEHGVKWYFDAEQVKLIREEI